jgi:hypothetical protein
LALALVLHLSGVGSSGPLHLVVKDGSTSLPTSSTPEDSSVVDTLLASGSSSSDSLPGSSSPQSGPVSSFFCYFGKDRYPALSVGHVEGVWDHFWACFFFKI